MVKIDLFKRQKSAVTHCTCIFRTHCIQKRTLFKIFQNNKIKLLNALLDLVNCRKFKYLQTANCLPTEVNSYSVPKQWNSDAC